MDLKDSKKDSKLALVWGAKSISERINRPIRATFNLLESGKIPGRRIGRRWVVSEHALQAFFADMSAKELAE